MTSHNSNMNTPLILFSEGLYTLTNLSPGFLMLSQTAFMKAFSTVFESVTMTGKKNHGENTQKIKKVVIELLPSGMFASLALGPLLSHYGRHHTKSVGDRFKRRKGGDFSRHKWMSCCRYGAVDILLWNFLGFHRFRGRQAKFM